jgi:hypothetical protein
MAGNILSRDEQLDLLRRLKSLTSKGSITWQAIGRAKDFDRDDVSRAVSGDFVFLLSSIDGDGVAPYRLVVIRQGQPGTVAEVAMIPLDEGGSEIVNDMLSELYEEATRRSRRSDEAVRQLFDSLDRLEHSDEPPF